jgi:hypothetical protein
MKATNGRRTGRPWWCAVSVAVAGMVGAAAQDPCASLPAEASHAAVMACVRALPVNATSANATLDFVAAMLETYSYVNLLRGTGPPWQMRVVSVVAAG